MQSRQLINSLLSNIANIKLNPLDEEGYSINAIDNVPLFLHLSTEIEELLTIYSVLARTDSLSTQQSLFVLKGLLALNQPTVQASNTRISLSNSGLITLSLNLDVNALHEQNLTQSLLDFIATLSKIRNHVQQLLHDSFNLDQNIKASLSTDHLVPNTHNDRDFHDTRTASALDNTDQTTALMSKNTTEDDYKKLFTNQQPILWG